ncbi:MAG TPA: PQQ-dependent sugar dehydrogenase [bacterium]|nr:PQQ-dependent sugar dehydrogenase [bacterium]
MRSPLLPVLALLALAAAFGCGGGSSEPNTPNDPGGFPPGNDDPAPIIDPRDLSAPPAPAQITVPTGFQLSIFADGLSGPRHMTRRGNEVWVANRSAGNIIVLRDLDGDGYAENKTTAASGLGSNHGIEYAPATGWFYTANTTTVSRFRDDNNDRIADAPPAAIITGLPSGGHNTRTVRVDPVTGLLYVSIGSSCNNCIESNQYRASIWVFNPDGTNGRLFAGGMRNAVGMAFQPRFNKLWAVNNGHDNLGDFLPKEHMWKVEKGKFYGWPYAYTNNGSVVPDPTFGPANPDKVAMTTPASWEFGAHTAPLGMTFWKSRSFGTARFGDAFVAFHGSWVPAIPVGYEVGLVRFNDAGQPTAFEVWVDNFRIGNNSPVARPVDVMQFGGALLISCDTGNVIYRLDKVA